MKLAFAALALVAALFFLGVGVGVSDDSSPTDTSPSGWVEWLGDAFLTREPMPLGDLTGACLSGETFLVRPGTPCKATIRESDSRLRILELSLGEGAEVGVTFEPADDNAAGVRVSLRTSARELELQVFGGGGELTLQFKQGLGGDRCTVRVVRD